MPATCPAVAEGLQVDPTVRPEREAIRVGFTLITPDQLIPQPHELVRRHGTPDTIAGWKALADGLLTNQSCVFHRNLEISSRYAWIYKLLPACFKWAGMAAFASHHVRLALFPLRLDTRSHRLRGHPAQPGSPEGAADDGREHDPRDEQRHLRRHLLGAPRVRHRRRRDRMPPRAPAGGAPLRPRPRRLRGDRPRTPRPGGRDGVRRRLDGRPRISSGRATSSCSSTSSAPWCSPTSMASRARSPGSSRSARP